MNQPSYQLGIQIAQLVTAIAQLTDTLRTQTRELQETRDLLEALGKAQGLEWSQDVKQWVSRSKLDALRHSPLDSPSA